MEPDCVYMRTTEIVAHQILARAQISFVAIFVSLVHLAVEARQLVHINILGIDQSDYIYICILYVCTYVFI